MIPPLENHFGKITAWSLIYFLNYAQFDISTQSQILGLTLYIRSIICRVARTGTGTPVGFFFKFSLFDTISASFYSLKCWYSMTKSLLSIEIFKEYFQHLEIESLLILNQGQFFIFNDNFLFFQIGIYRVCF